MKFTIGQKHLQIFSRHKPFTCAHTPKSNRWCPIVFTLINMKRESKMNDVKWFYRLWIYTWVGQWSIDLDGGRKEGNYL